MIDSKPAAALSEIGQARLATLGTLIAGIAHELNTPMGAIHSNHDVIRRALLKLQDILADEVVTPDELQEVRRVVRAMRSVLRTNRIAVDRMVQLVGSLRNFGRLDGSDVAQVDLHEGMNGTILLLGHELTGIKVVKDYGDLPQVRCHPSRVNQVFMNLVHNGVQAMAGSGRLTITTRANPDEMVTVAVSDTGRGIDPETLERIFEPGFTTKGGRIGMGLGLAISGEIVRRHGGTIAVETEVGKGTTFTVRLPVNPPLNEQ